MVRQYLDTLEWETVGAPSYDSEGNPVIPTPVSHTTVKCRYENFTSGNRRTYRNRNGDDVLATGTVYVKKGETVPERFIIATLHMERDGVIDSYNLECLNVYHGQLNITIHVTENVGN